MTKIKSDVTSLVCLKVWREQDDYAQMLHLSDLHGSPAAISWTQQVLKTFSKNPDDL